MIGVADDELDVLELDFDELLVLPDEELEGVGWAVELVVPDDEPVEELDELEDPLGLYCATQVVSSVIP